jgi:hypothetical protein
MEGLPYQGPPAATSGSSKHRQADKPKDEDLRQMNVFN